jgi:hypothetical protein
MIFRLLSYKSSCCHATWFFPSNFNANTFSSSRFANSSMIVNNHVTTPKINSWPPSPLISMPRINKWLAIAPDIMQSTRIKAYRLVWGIHSNKIASNSNHPRRSLPHGSIPILLKMYTDSSAPENLKNKVCPMIRVINTLKIKRRVFIAV